MRKRKEQQKYVRIFTDGACSGNPGAGGYAAILQFRKNSKRYEKIIKGGYRLTTNNRMELKAIIEALKALKEPVIVDIYTDSQYIAHAFEKGWFHRWKEKNWKREKNKPVKNVDLWKELDQLLQIHTVRFHWIRGHSGIPDNERVDQIATSVLKHNNLPPDHYFEAEYKKTQRKSK